MLIKIRYMLIFQERWLCLPFVHVDKRGRGIKFGSNLVHVVIECPLNGLNYVHLLYFFHSIAFEINSRNLSAYCSGSTVEMPSTLDPYLTVFATLAACFLTPEKHR